VREGGRKKGVRERESERESERERERERKREREGGEKEDYSVRERTECEEKKERGRA